MSMANSSTGRDHHGTVVKSWKPNPQKGYRRTTLPELLRLRETHGLLQQRRYRGQGYGSASNPHHVASTSYLSYRGAWNPTRMQNTILIVGPGTPASTVKTTPEKKEETREEAKEEAEPPSSSSSASLNSHRSDAMEDHNERSDGGEMEDDRSVEQDGMETNDEDEDDEGEDDEDDEDDDDDDSSSQEFNDFVRSNFGNYEDIYDSSCDEESLGPGRRKDKCKENYFSSMRHGGCINTAAWLTSDCGWRLSKRNGESSVVLEAVQTEELPTQIVTSGDDRLLKVWDVSEAMGGTSPLAGGPATLTPFSSQCCSNDNLYGYKERWQSFYDSRRKKTTDEFGDDYRPQGTVRLLATASTGHKGNVFHVTPLKGRPGTFATCAADGFLRLVDVERSYASGNGAAIDGSSGNSSTAVIHPMYDHNSDDNPPLFNPENPLAFFLRNSCGMCFSHTMLDDVNVGLLCSEKGLLRFDFRLSPREQCTKSLLPQTIISSGSMIRSLMACKACTVLRTDSGSGEENSISGGSTYVFAGGSSPAVALCDLRMTAASSHQRSSGSRVVQYYKPASLSEENNVSVSGLDLSRDGKELLVSYESDQIYTFPVFPYSQSPRRSASDQLEELLSKDGDIDQDDNESRLYPWGQGKRVLPELASYGAHLNRFTFLKNARYAGPRDEYICTGSDSGHAWIYEKATGAVVSFWNADQSTCNGVVPHPKLPIFVTYGIDKTAKLWRSTIPVDPDVDDSAVGRRKQFRMTKERSYNMSPTARNWIEVRKIIQNLNVREASRISDEPEIYPDQIPCSKVLLRRGRLARDWFREPDGGRVGSQKIGNDLHNLPTALKANLYTVLRSLFDDDDVPVESNFHDFKRRISLIRLRHQADSLGLTWNPNAPWMMESRPAIDKKNETLKDSNDDLLVEPSELVPEYPSDWIPYDAEMTEDPFDFRNYFCSKSNGLYADFYSDRYSALDERGVIFSVIDSYESDHADVSNIQMKECCSKTKNDTDVVLNESEKGMQNIANYQVETDSVGADKAEQKFGRNGKETIGREDFVRRSNQILSETVKTLKDSGNDAFKAGKLSLAAHQYDKAIQYGAAAYMKKSNAGVVCFDGLMKNLIMTRLNMALTMLNPHFMELQVAMKQAKLALEEVSPFCDFSIDKNERNLDEALALKAKAYFRLGSAQYEMGNFHESIKSLEESIVCTNSISNPNENNPDSLVLRRLAQAKRERLKHSKRQRKKFKFAFAPQSSQPASKEKSESALSPEIPPSSKSLSLPSTTTMETSTGERDTDDSVASATSQDPTRKSINTVTPMNSPALEAEPKAPSRAEAERQPKQQEK